MTSCTQGGRVPKALRPRKAVEDIVATVNGIHYWVDEQIRLGRTDDEIVAMAPVAIAFINGDLSLAELRRAIEESK